MDYLLGLATLPAILAAGWLIVAAASVALRVVGSVSLGVVRRTRPTDQEHMRRKRAEVMYALQHAVLFTQGEFVVIVGRGLDDERRKYARRGLLRQPQAPTQRKG